MSISVVLSSSFSETVSASALFFCFVQPWTFPPALVIDKGALGWVCAGVKSDERGEGLNCCERCCCDGDFGDLESPEVSCFLIGFAEIDWVLLNEPVAPVLLMAVTVSPA